jgi:hypothetical protein
MNEIWKINEEFPDYKISSSCRVIRIHTTSRSSAGTELSGRVIRGYRLFKLVNKDGKQVYIRAARLMLMTFVGPPPTATHQAAHNDNHKDNNAISNLRWATPKENNADKIKHGTRQVGENSGTARLTSREVLEIRKLFDAGENNLTAIARKFGCGRTTIGHIINSRTWHHLPPCRADRLSSMFSSRRSALDNRGAGR